MVVKQLHLLVKKLRSKTFFRKYISEKKRLVFAGLLFWQCELLKKQLHFVLGVLAALLKTFQQIFFKCNLRSSRVLRKRCSENMQQIYKRTPMPKCGFNKVEK